MIVDQGRLSSATNYKSVVSYKSSKANVGKNAEGGFYYAKTPPQDGRHLLGEGRTSMSNPSNHIKRVTSAFHQSGPG
jgi:hypothetical protein